MNEIALIIGYAVMATCGIGGTIAAMWFVIDFCLDRLKLTKDFMLWMWNRRKRIKNSP